MPAIAYFANLFPSLVEPYVVDEVCELRRRGVAVLCCSARRVKHGLDKSLQPFAVETLYLEPLRAAALLRAAWLCVTRISVLAGFLWHALFRGREPLRRRVFALLHTLLSVYYSALLRDQQVEHIHVHHGYFGSWIAMVAARLLGVSFSVTLHGSDLLLDGAYLDSKLKDCRFCITISEYNRHYILKHFPAVARGKIVVSRLGVDVTEPAESPQKDHDSRHCFTLLTVGRLHAVKDHAFLVRACA